jgi:hypothetical protein
MFGGAGYPLTLRTFLRSYGINNTFPGQPNDPGDRRSGFDFSYRVPKLREWLLIYSDSYTEDEFSPVAYPYKSAFRPGVYLPKLPGFRKLDLRGEGVFTDLPRSLDSRGIHYFNFRFLSGYTNQQQLIGDWIGRNGRGVQLASNYWISPEQKVTVGYRWQDVPNSFLGGGQLHDFRVMTDLRLGSGVRIAGGIQYETWRFGLLSPTREQNLALTVQFTVEPKRAIRR